MPHASVDAVIRTADELLEDETPHSVHEFVRDAAIDFVRNRRLEAAFELLATFRLPLQCRDVELLRLYNSLARFEHGRLARRRRILQLVLFGVLMYLFFVSPTVFVSLENPYRAAHQLSELDWSEGL